MAGVGLKPIPLMPSPSSPMEASISCPVISESCQVMAAASVESGLLFGEVMGAREGEGWVVEGDGGGGERILFGLVFGFELVLLGGKESVFCLASGDGIGE